jgi:hypothetical protein
MEWISTKDELPKPGDLIVKKWLYNGAVWAGRYSQPASLASRGDSSFDLWIKLPEGEK